MAVTRLETLQARLRRYLEAEAAILRGQEYQLENRRLRRADLTSVRAAIKELEDEIATLEMKSNGRVRRVVFID